MKEANVTRDGVVVGANRNSATIDLANGYVGRFHRRRLQFNFSRPLIFPDQCRLPKGVFLARLRSLLPRGNACVGVGMIDALLIVAVFAVLVLSIIASGVNQACIRR